VADAPGDSRMMGSFLDSSDRGLTFVLLTGLSSLTVGSYDVYIYSNGDGHGGRHGFFSLGFGGGVLECTDFGVFDGAHYVEDLQDGHGGNFVHFRGVKGDSLLLVATAQNPNDPSDNGAKAPINGIQIVAVNAQ
jgi:hypothetical protein